MGDVMELARFGVVDGADVGPVAAAMDAWLARQPGFVSRTLVGPDDDGRYTDLVRWRSMGAAKEAMEAIGSSPEAGAFMAIIDPTTVEMRHAPLVLEQ